MAAYSRSSIQRINNRSIIQHTQSYVKVPKDFRLNSTHFFITKFWNKRELQQIALNHSSDIDSKDFMKIYKKWDCLRLLVLSFKIQDDKESHWNYYLPKVKINKSSFMIDGKNVFDNS